MEHQPHRRIPSSASAANTVASRRASLISKQTAPVVKDLRPSDLLIERFKGWKNITKQLRTYFEGIADIENNTASALTKVGGTLEVPFRDGNQFLGEGGLQDIYQLVRDKTRQVADLHASLAKTVDSSIVQHLVKVETEVKAHIKHLQRDIGTQAAIVAGQRELSISLISSLATAITQLKNTPLAVNARNDPHLLNLAVQRQLVNQVHAENNLQKSIIVSQQASAHFEEGIIRSLQSAWFVYNDWQTQTASGVQRHWEDMAAHFASLPATKEWVSFAARSDSLLDPDTPLRDPTAIDYPGRDDPSVMSVHEGFLQRKKRYTNHYQESFYVLTPAGFLHQMGDSSDPARLASTTPSFSLFLPECTLGPASTLSSKSHKFHITVGSLASNTRTGLFPKGKGLSITRSRTLFEKSEQAYAFKARSHAEMKEWWNDIKQLSKVYLTSSEQMDRSGPVPLAVRSAGYTAEDLADDGDEEDGSSIEEEAETEDEEEATPETPEHAPPQLADLTAKELECARPRYPEKVQLTDGEPALESYTDVKRPDGPVPILARPTAERVPSGGILTPPLDPRSAAAAAAAAALRTHDRPPTPMVALGSGSGTPRRRVSIQIEPKGEHTSAAAVLAGGRASLESSQVLSVGSE